MNSQTTIPDDMPTEIDFSNAVRGKFFNPNARLNLPVYLEPQIETFLTQRAAARGIEFGVYVNQLLRKDVELIEAFA